MKYPNMAALDPARVACLERTELCGLGFCASGVAEVTGLGANEGSPRPFGKNRESYFLPGYYNQNRYPHSVYIKRLTYYSIINMEVRAVIRQ